MDMVYDVIVVGGGPAGLTAAIYCARDKKKVLVIEKEIMGGKITETPIVNNIPGFIEISGADFGEKLEAQATKFGVEIAYDEVLTAEEYNNCVYLTSEMAEYYGKTCIIAAGTKNRTLGTPGEEELIGSGIHFCVTCDGLFYQNKDVIVVGGGNSALTEALELSHLAKNITILQNLADLTGEKELVERVNNTKNINVVTNATIYDIKRVAVDRLELTTSLGKYAVDGVFEAIGLVPQNLPFSMVTNLDQRGFIASSKYPNVFACGDCVANTKQQVAIACGEGAKTAIDALHYLNTLII